MPASASAICERAESAAAFCASAPPTALSNCCCETSSLASSPFSRSASHARLGRRQPRTRGVELAFGPEHAALRLGDAAVRGRDVAGRFRRRDRHIALRRKRVGFGIGQLGARLLEGHLVVARIDLDEHVAGVDLLVVGDRHPKDGAADTRGNLRHVRIHLGIVGRLAPRGDPVPDRDAEHGENDEAGGNPNARLLCERYVVGHQRVPPRNCRSVASAVPTPRISAPFARS
jgi:hypothetical protein